MHIRLAQAADAGAIASLYHELVDDPAITVLPEQIERLAANPDQALLVVEQQDRLLATVHLQFCTDTMYARQPYALLENLVVAASARGQGIGALLLAEVERRCLAHDCSKIMLLSTASRLDAHRFFAAQGYDGERKRGFVKYRRNFRSAAI